jgi:hypothetical protein
MKLAIPLVLAMAIGSATVAPDVSAKTTDTPRPTTTTKRSRITRW